jgi:predicted component of type VI protein secretion system
VPVPQHIDVAIRQVVELHAPRLRRVDVILDVKQEPISLGFFEAE